jgi:hypothetical protein
MGLQCCREIHHFSEVAHFSLPVILDVMAVRNFKPAVSKSLPERTTEHQNKI